MSDDFVAELEEELVHTAIVAILGCDADTAGKIVPTTLEVGKFGDFAPL